MPALVAILWGAVLAIATAYALGTVVLCPLAPPPDLILAAGSAALSVPIFFIVLAGRVGAAAFLLLSALILTAALMLWSRRPGLRVRSGSRPPLGFAATKPYPVNLKLISALILAPYAIWYFVNALAPETLPDGIGYHLGLPYQYFRLGGFPTGLTFFDAVPQGMEMLYTMAFAFGRHSAAKLVEFTFLLATVPLMLRIARRLGLGDVAGIAAAVLYFCSPIAGVTGSSSYTDAAMVFFSLAAFDSLLAWRDSGRPAWLLAAGLTAGFCYAIKLPGAVVVPGAVLFILARRSNVLRSLGLLLGSAAFVAAPWLVRNFVLTGNPIAPLGNAIFPNPAFHIFTERELAQTLRSLGSVRPLQLPWELAFGGHLIGIFGPLLWMLPLALLAWRRPNARLCLAAAAILAVPWLANKGARFLMPAAAMTVFPAVMVLPRRAAWAAIAVQSVVCWPQLLNLWQPDWIFRLHDFPLRAALRIQPDALYLAHHSAEYRVAKMVEASTPPAARIFSLDAVANAYLARDVVVSWQSAEGDRMTDTLRLATVYSDATLYAWTGSWPTAKLRALRFRLPVAHAEECDISEIETSPPVRGRVSLSSWPNPWEAPLAIDGNLATRWRTWQPIRPGTFFELDFASPQSLGAGTLLSHAPVFDIPMEIYGEAPEGSWRLLSASPGATPLPSPDLRRAATLALLRAGFDYLLVPTSTGGHAPVGRRIASEPQAWGVKQVGAAEGEVLLRL